jgi:hypothetical protein
MSAAANKTLAVMMPLSCPNPATVVHTAPIVIWPKPKMPDADPATDGMILMAFVTATGLHMPAPTQ